MVEIVITVDEVTKNILHYAAQDEYHKYVLSKLLEDKQVILSRIAKSTGKSKTFVKSMLDKLEELNLGWCQKEIINVKGKRDVLAKPYRFKDGIEEKVRYYQPIWSKW